MGYRCQRRLFLAALAGGLLVACSAPQTVTTIQGMIELIKLQNVRLLDDRLTEEYYAPG